MASSDTAQLTERGRLKFATTQWSIVLAAGRDRSHTSRVALATLCELYWYPLIPYVRRQGYVAEDAQDLTQEFFARLLEKNYLQQAEPARGRFRSFLLAAFKHFLSTSAIAFVRRSAAAPRC